MSNERKVVHEIKLERSIKLLLALAVVMLGLQVFGPAFSVNEAWAELSGSIPRSFAINLVCTGCS